MGDMRVYFAGWTWSRATVRSFFGAIATGDASIQTAAQNGGITEIHHVDYEAQNVAGVIADFTVVVYGN